MRIQREKATAIRNVGTLEWKHMEIWSFLKACSFNDEEMEAQ